MFGPMRQHDEHEDLQPSFMPIRIDLLVKAGIRPWRTMNIWNRRIRNCHNHPPQTEASLENVTTITLQIVWVNSGIVLAARRCPSRNLEMIIGLQKDELPVRIFRINR